MMESAGRAESRAELESALWQREDTFSTGIGFGVAIPHCQTRAVRAASVAFLRFATPFDWDGTGGEARGFRGDACASVGRERVAGPFENSRPVYRAVWLTTNFATPCGMRPMSSRSSRRSTPRSHNRGQISDPAPLLGLRTDVTAAIAARKAPGQICHFTYFGEFGVCLRIHFL